MSRSLAALGGLVTVVLIANGCSNVVRLAEGYYPPMLDTGEVRVIDARGMERAGFERTLNEHLLIARFDVRIPQSADFEQRLAEEVEKGKSKALTAGGNVLMYTDESEMIAVIKRDARYAGAQDAITMYVMLHRT